MPEASIVPRSDYHSAMTQALIEPEPCEEFRIGASIAFRHDLTDGLPPHYQFCESVYADLPWRSGFAEFNRRAGIEDGRTYRQFMAATAGVVESIPSPTALVTGRHALPYLPRPDAVVGITLQTTGKPWPAVAILYRDEPGNWGTATDLLVDWAGRYGSIGDFCCGYGRALKVFQRKHKPWVGTDYNPRCIGYIAEHAKEW